jgi:hypothetical protein
LGNRMGADESVSNPFACPERLRITFRKVDILSALVESHIVLDGQHAHPTSVDNMPEEEPRGFGQANGGGRIRIKSIRLPPFVCHEPSRLTPE